MKMHSSKFFSLELLRETSENALEISGNLVPQKCGHPITKFLLNGWVYERYALLTVSTVLCRYHLDW